MTRLERHVKLHLSDFPYGHVPRIAVTWPFISAQARAYWPAGVRPRAGASVDCIGENPRGLEAQTPRSTSAATGRQRPDWGKLMPPITQYPRLAQWAVSKRQRGGAPWRTKQIRRSSR